MSKSENGKWKEIEPIYLEKLKIIKMNRSGTNDWLVEFEKIEYWIDLAIKKF